MGVYLRLTIVPSRIAHAEWLEVYKDSLVLLHGYPGEMMGIKHEEINSAEREVYSRTIEHDADDPEQRHWHVVGDFESQATGESFIFYSDLDYYGEIENRSRNRKNKK